MSYVWSFSPVSPQPKKQPLTRMVPYGTIPYRTTTIPPPYHHIHTVPTIAYLILLIFCKPPWRLLLLLVATFVKTARLQLLVEVKSAFRQPTRTDSSRRSKPCPPTKYASIVRPHGLLGRLSPTVSSRLVQLYLHLNVQSLNTHLNEPPLH